MNIKCIGSGSKGNAYLLNDGYTTLLIECGVPFKKIQQACNFKTSEIAGCLITHEHKDHCKCVDDVLKRGIDVYCTYGTAKALNIQDNPYFNGFLDLYNLIYTAGSFVFKEFKTEHDAAEPCGFLIESSKTLERLLYITDSYYCRYTFANLTDIMIECNYDDESLIHSNDNVALRKRVLRSHMSLNNCVEFLKSNDLSRVDCIHLIHLSDRNSDEERMKRKVAEATGKRVVVF